MFAEAGLPGRFGAEFEMHYDSLHTPIDVGENTFLFGLRYSALKEDWVTVYGKVLGGIGRFEYQRGIYSSNPHGETYGVVSFGGGIELRASRYVSIRAIDLEYQKWPGFPPSGLSPAVASVGAAYRF